MSEDIKNSHQSQNSYEYLKKYNLVVTVTTVTKTASELACDKIEQMLALNERLLLNEQELVNSNNENFLGQVSLNDIQWDEELENETKAVWAEMNLDGLYYFRPGYKDGVGLENNFNINIGE